MRDEPASRPAPEPGSRRHAAEPSPSRTPAPWSLESWTSEAVLGSEAWRERSAGSARSGESGAPSGAGGPADRPEALELRIEPPLGRRLSRAIAVPVTAGAAAFAIAVTIAIVLTALQLRPAAEAAERITSDVARGSSAERASVPVSGSGKAAADAGSGGAPAADADAAPVLVHVVGEVAKPGVVELPAGSRVADAIEAAGGAGQEAELSAVNLARVVSDGEQILVPNAEQAAGGTGGAGATGADARGTSGTASGGTASGVLGPDGLVDLNRADAAALETLPRVGPALARRIVDWREANGGFASVEQLLEVSGIGAKTLDGFRELVVVR